MVENKETMTGLNKTDNLHNLAQKQQQSRAELLTFVPPLILTRSHCPEGGIKTYGNRFGPKVREMLSNDLVRSSRNNPHN